jgi:Zn-dependent peptidase ImmA (M78 family)
MAGLRRGFKTEANAHAVALRRELQLDDHAPLCPWRLAKYLDVPVVALSDLKSFEPRGVLYLAGKGRSLFSAVTIFVGRHGRKRVIFHNDAHVKSRQAANLAHELAHAILCHPPTRPFVIDKVAEEEAKWLGPTLLVPDQAALHIVETRMAAHFAESLYGVSSRLLQMRLNVSGARIRAQRRGR